MSDETEIKVGSDEGEGIKLTASEDRIFITGTWKTRTSKSKKGNMNMSWHNRVLFDEAINAYMKVRKTFIDKPKEQPKKDDDQDIPF